MAWRGGARSGMRALGRVRGHKVGMNRLERDYYEALRLGQQVGEIEWFAFDAIKLRLADNTFYIADFFVMRAGGRLEVHEVKGFWEEDARLKIKVAAEIYPFQFFGVTRERGAWKLEEF